MREIYKEALALSRKFNTRNIEETKKLYSIIQDAVALAQKEGDSRDTEEAISFLTKVYEPYLKTIAGKYYPYVETKLEFEDVLHEVYVIFLILLGRYDSMIASFSYFIKKMLPKNVYVWVDKLRSKKYITIDVQSVEDTLFYLNMEDCDTVFEYFNTAILEKEYIDFIIERSKKSNRSDTVRQVCNKIFLGSMTCSELANELDITYHAVYEVMNKIKRELMFFFGENRYSGVLVTSTGLRYT